VCIRSLVTLSELFTTASNGCIYNDQPLVLSHPHLLCCGAFWSCVAALNLTAVLMLYLCLKLLIRLLGLECHCEICQVAALHVGTCHVAACYSVAYCNDQQ